MTDVLSEGIEAFRPFFCRMVQLCEQGRNNNQLVTPKDCHVHRSTRTDLPSMRAGSPLVKQRRSMDFYHTDEETPLLKSITVQSSPHEDPNHRSELIFSEEPQADVAGMTDTDRLRHMQTEVELSLDKVSFIYSPKSDGFTTFHGPSRSYQDAELSVLDPYFDVTISRLRVIFDNAHPDGTKSMF